eukprot:TRINITY_DN6340_c0_g1_i3.p1 TRINITY_DN6340_c0_g1~~TRINITY_DN6340_c0_g1_i3.p1  ORF type:complete len:286 (+),score=19.82 TRINITY_DN6340_c0_g1_i3:557-1414(+)
MKITNSSITAVHFVMSQQILVKNVTVNTLQNPLGPSCVVVDSSSDTEVIESSFSCGSDHIAIKSGNKPMTGNYSSNNINISGCKFYYGQGITIGAEISGGVENVLIENSIIIGAAGGLNIKTLRTKGGKITDVTYQDLSFQNVGTLMSVFMNVDHSNNSVENHLYPNIGNITISNIVGFGVSIASFICLPENPCSWFTLNNISLQAEQYFDCQFITGQSTNVSPLPCASLRGIPQQNGNLFTLLEEGLIGVSVGLGFISTLSVLIITVVCCRSENHTKKKVPKYL